MVSFIIYTNRFKLMRIYLGCFCNVQLCIRFRSTSESIQINTLTKTKLKKHLKQFAEVLQGQYVVTWYIFK